MIITFCGHSDFSEQVGMRKQALEIIESVSMGEAVDFYLGQYGNFDSFGFGVAKEYKATHSDSKLIFVTPYLAKSYLSTRTNGYDEVIYPIEDNVPPRFAISYRNKWIVEKSDIVIAYVKRSSGGAYQTLKYAEKHNKKIFRL